MTHDTKLRREAEHLTLVDRANSDGIWPRNAVITSPSGTQTIKVNATLEALQLWQKAGWTWRWLRNGE